LLFSLSKPNLLGEYQYTLWKQNGIVGEEESQAAISFCIGFAFIKCRTLMWAGFVNKVLAVRESSSHKWNLPSALRPSGRCHEHESVLPV